MCYLRLLGEEDPVDLVKNWALKCLIPGCGVGFRVLMCVLHSASLLRRKLSKVTVLQARIGTGPNRLEEDELREGLESGAHGS
jgi:hypothetical protein